MLAPPLPRAPMAPLPPPEPARHLETTASLEARKIRFELNAGAAADGSGRAASA
jgi:hypothetical protein